MNERHCGKASSIQDPADIGRNDYLFSRKQAKQAKRKNERTVEAFSFVRLYPASLGGLFPSFFASVAAAAAVSVRLDV